MTGRTEKNLFFLRAHVARNTVLRICLWLPLCLAFNCHAATVPSRALFQKGTNAYLKGDFEQAVLCFRGSVATDPSAGGWHNLGNAEWESGHAGAAILAWERGHWLDPFNAGTSENLRFARKARQLDAPELTWYETCSAWLPANAWPWIAGASFWAAVSLLMLPGIFRQRKTEWHQGLAAVGFGIFLLTLPALAGIHTRTKIGVLLPEATPLRLTPTAEAQVLGKLPTGETARFERERGKYVFIRSGSAAGWIERSQFGLISSDL